MMICAEWVKDFSIHAVFEKFHFMCGRLEVKKCFKVIGLKRAFQPIVLFKQLRWCHCQSDPTTQMTEMLLCHREFA